MRLDGIHHVTCITGDAPRNVDFYTRVLGLRLVKKSVNQDDPTVYHLFYADEEGSPGSDITFFEPCLSVIVKPGPSTPLSFVAVEAVPAAWAPSVIPSAAVRAIANVAIRLMSLLPGLPTSIRGCLRVGLPDRIHRNVLG